MIIDEKKKNIHFAVLKMVEMILKTMMKKSIVDALQVCFYE